MTNTEKPEFDHYAASYEHELNRSIPRLAMESAYLAEYKIERIASNMPNHQSLNILDFGCGVGRSLNLLRKHFPSAELWGFDVSAKSIALARQRISNVQLTHKIETLPLHAFDIIFAANVFHHIPLAQRLSAIQNCKRLLKADGHFFIFEHNPYNPLTRLIFARCVFDQDAAMLRRATTLALAQEAGLSVVRSEYTLFFPRPLAFLRGLERFLGWLPLGAQYYVEMA
ncbi:MAG TPA: class I SAM-dependent methyltransferase [Methylotenera sp.]